MKHYKELRLILADQLNRSHSWLEVVNDQVLYVFMEIRPESEYVTHHIQKILGLFQGMRVFAGEMEAKGHAVRYFKIGDTDNLHDFGANLQRLIEAHGIEKWSYQQPDEWRLDQQFATLASALKIRAIKVSTEHFLVGRDEFEELFGGKYFLESFYRKLRKRFDVLMEDGEPLTGKWNYDHENRKKLPANHEVPEAKTFDHDLTQLFDEVKAAGLPFIGTVDANHFIWPKNREEALENLDYFLEELFKNFGKYQDALTGSSWSVYHSRVSFALNAKILHPMEVIRAAEHQLGKGDVSISAVEGFIRQILGWREYMRGIYWSEMPEYAQKNFFQAQRKLPDFFWTGDTRMACMKQAIDQSLTYAYAHHIQRLMVTGNFAMLSGINPDELDQWYLGIYIDAYEWVEITNTRGMSQYADGGIVGTKPYAASASYIHKMGDHCKSCHYQHTKKTGENACPFNSFYWDFLDRHRDLLGKNQRMSMMYRVWDKYDSDEQQALKRQAAHYLENIESL